MRRPVLLSLAILSSALVGTAALAPAADAHERSSAKGRKYESQRSYDRRQYSSRKVETMDDIRANAYDPACNYCGQPSWARAALSPKDGGSGRR